MLPWQVLEEVYVSVYILRLLRQVERTIMYVCYIALVMATLIGIVTRLIPGVNNVVWGMELSRFAMVWMVMLINAVNIQQRDEIVIEVLISRVPDRVRRIMAIISDILVIGFLVVMFVFGLKVCVDNARQMTASLGISMRYIYICMPLGALCMLIEKVIVLVQDVRSTKPIKNAGEEVIDQL